MCFTRASGTHLCLAADTFVSYHETILVIHHNAILVFTFGVIAKSYIDFGLKQHLRSLPKEYIHTQVNSLKILNQYLKTKTKRLKMKTAQRS